MEFIFNFFPRAIFTYNHAVSLLESFTIEIGNLWWVPLNLFEFALMFDGYFFILSFSLSFSDATSSRKQLLQNSLPSNRLGVMLDITKIKNKKVITCAYVLLEVRLFRKLQVWIWWWALRGENYCLGKSHIKKFFSLFIFLENVTEQ